MPLLAIPYVTALFLWRDSNDKLSASRSLGRVRYRDVSQQFSVGPHASLSVMYSQCLLRGSTVTIKMGKSTCSRLDVSASLGLLQYWRVCSDINDGIHIIFI